MSFDAARCAERILAEESTSRLGGTRLVHGECSAGLSETVPSPDVPRSCG
ncbi:hypothetical protein BURPS668_A3246 [Burkholderia pseudomallei 668]|nr:hypothetical protein BURPS668_A3246 [Burkholderia pseudomallei 668]